MTGLRDDARQSLRRLRHQPVFTIVASLTLALGLGANTAIFTLIRAVAWQALPVAAPRELYRLGDDTNCCVNSGFETSWSLFSYPLYAHLREQASEFTALAAFQANAPAIGVRPSGTSITVSLPAEFVSGNYFSVFRVSPAAGRLLEPDDDRPGAQPVVVISHRIWTEQFSRDPAAVGRSIDVGGVTMTLVGVTAEGFFGDTARPDPAGVWIPLGQEPAVRGQGTILARPDQNWLYAIGRMAPGASPAGAATHLTAQLRLWLAAQTFVPAIAKPKIPDQSIPVVPAPGGVPVLQLTFSQPLTVLLTMSALVLLLAAANLANLLLARANRGEASLRTALGASPARLIRQALVDGLLLAAIGGAGALAVATLATRTMVSLAFPGAGFVPLDVSLSAPVLTFSAALAVLTAVVFSAAPAWALAHAQPVSALRGTGRGTGERGFVPRRSLVIVQVAISLVLLVGAGLLGRSLRQLEQQPLGFDAAQRLVATINPPAFDGQIDRLATLYRAMADRLSSIPGVDGVTYSLYSPMEGNNWSSLISIAGRPSDANNPDSSSWNRIGPRYFETLGTRVIRGRAVDDRDTPTSHRVAVVNEAFVRHFLPDGNPIGRRLGIGDEPHAGDREIVGVVEDVKYSGANQPTRPMIFLPAFQTVEYQDATSANVQARSTLLRAIEIRTSPSAAGLEPLIRRAIGQVDPTIAIVRLRSLTDQVNVNFRTNRLMATLTSAYGLVALALAALGLYGVTSYGVSRRRREFGVRLALGAEPRRLVRDIVLGALLQTGVGLAIGVPLALVAASGTASLLYGVTARDPAIVTTAVAVLAVTTIIAALVPARRAAAVDPTEALRAE